MKVTSVIAITAVNNVLQYCISLQVNNKQKEPPALSKVDWRVKLNTCAPLQYFKTQLLGLAGIEVTVGEGQILLKVCIT